MRPYLMTLSALFLVACGSDPQLGDPCTDDSECGDLECHFHDGAAEGFCDDDGHDDDHDDD